MPKSRYVVYTGAEGEAEDAEVAVPGLPVFHRGVPQLLPETTAKELVEGADKKAKDVKPAVTPVFRFAKQPEVAKAEKAAKRDAKKAEDEVAVEEPPAEEAE